MPITSVTSDPEALTLTVVGEYDVPVARLWQAYADPRQLERFWGPVEWPATFTRHDMAVGGESRYAMTGPDGTVARGWFRFLAIDPERRIEVEDGFAREDGTPDPSMPTMHMVFSFEPTATGSRFTGVTRFQSLEAMEQVLEMGMEEGMRSAMSQVDGVLADAAAFDADRPTEARLLGATQARVSRILKGTPEAVWRAHHGPALMKRWLLGPDGWTMPVCELGHRAGDAYRYGWTSEDGSASFGFEGEILESSPPHREVTSERMSGTDGPATRNEMTLTAVPAGTLLVLVITYPDAETREAILATGMTEGMEASYRRLEAEILRAPA